MPDEEEKEASGGGHEAYHPTAHGPVYERDGRVYLRSRQDGQLYSFDESEALPALQSGYAPVTQQEVLQRDREKEEEAKYARDNLGGVKAFGEAAARSVIDTASLPAQLAGLETLTGGEVLEEVGEELGDEGYGQEQRGRAEYHKLASLAGSIAPDVALTLGSGGASLGLKTGAKGIAKKIAKDSAKSRIAKAVATDAAYGAVAGGAMAGEEAWRQNRPVDSAALVANMGMGAIISGGLGAVGLAAASGIGVARRAATSSKTAGAIRRNLPDVTEGVGNVFENLASSGRVSGRIPGGAGVSVPGGVKRRVGKYAAEKLTGGRAAMDAYEAGQTAARRTVDDAKQATQKMTRRYEQEATEARKRLARAKDQESRAMRELREMEGSAQGRIAKAEADATKSISRAQSEAVRLEESARRRYKKATEALEKREYNLNRKRSMNTERLTKAEANIPKRERAVQNLESDLEEHWAARPPAKAKDKRAKWEAKRTTLERKRKEASEELRRRKEEVERLRTRQDEELADFKQREYQRVKREKDDAFQGVARAKREGAKRISREKRAQAERVEALRREVAERGRELSDRFADAKKKATVAAGDEALAEARLKLGPRQAETAESAAMAEARQAALAGEQQANEIWRGTAGYRIMDRTMGAAQGAARMGGRPAVLAAAESQHQNQGDLAIGHAQDEVLRKMDAAVLQATGVDRSTPWTPVSGVGDYDNYPHGQFRYPGESRREAFEARTEEIAELATNPELMIDSISESTRALSHYSPEMVQDILATSERAVQFLSRFGGSKEAKNPLDPTNTQGHVTNKDLMLYERVWNASMFPAKVLDELATWNLTEETVMTTREVHPEFFRAVQEKVSDRVLSGEWKPSLQQRIQLSGLLGVVDSSAQPQFQYAYSSVQKGSVQKKNQRAPKPGRPRGSPTFAQQHRTLSESVHDSIGNE